MIEESVNGVIPQLLSIQEVSGMAVNRFVLNAMSFHGHGAINEIPGIVASKGFKKAFVASDPDLVKFGVTAKVTDLLAKNGIEFEVYSNIKPNPTIETFRKALTLTKLPALT